MDEEEASAATTWRYEPFSNHTQAPSDYQPTGLPFDDPLDDPYDDRQSPAGGDYEPATRYPFDRHPTPSFESTLRLQARPPIERASSSAAHLHNARFHLPSIGNMAFPAPRRFPGDGLDYRRPAGSSREQEAAASVDLTGDEDGVAVDLSQDDDVIDLTADDSGYGASQNGNTAHEQHYDRGQEESHRGRRHAPRLPRGMDIIIDLDNGEEEWNFDPPVPQPSSPEIEFISSRPIEGRRPLPTHEQNSDGEEVEFIRANALPVSEARRRQRIQELDHVMGLFGTLNGRFTNLRAQVDRFHAQVNRTANRFHEPIAPSRSASRGRAPHVRVGAFMAPVLDFDATGFDLVNPRAREAPAPPSTYNAPPKAPEGFTRSPEEEGGALICPNCEEELCVGSDDTKRQVWIVKGCGHVSHCFRRMSR